MILGPHSYNAAPCELWFALFKQDNINPKGNIVQRRAPSLYSFHKRAAIMKTEFLVLNWSETQLFSKIEATLLFHNFWFLKSK